MATSSSTTEGVVSVRPAESRDIETIVALGARMHRESQYREFEFSPSKVAGYIELVVRRPSLYCLFVAQRWDQIIGFIGGYWQSVLFGPMRVAFDSAFYVVPEHRGSTAAKRLVTALRDWARDQGAAELCLGISSGINTERAERLYEHLGLTRAGALYKQPLA